MPSVYQIIIKNGPVSWLNPVLVLLDFCVGVFLCVVHFCFIFTLLSIILHLYFLFVPEFS